MSHASSIALLSSLLKPENDARPTFLFGAGASFSSGVPLAADAVKRLAKRAYVDLELGGTKLPEQVKLSEWMSWLQGQSWFVQGEEYFAENFPLVIEHLLRPEAYRRSVLLELISLRQDLGQGYRAVADLVLRGLASTILTTNFDTCLPKALAEKQPHIRNIAEVNRAPDDFNEFSIFSRAQIVWLHGKTEQYTDRNLISETQELQPELVEKLKPLLESTPLVVVGYRGAENSILKSLLGPDTGIKFRNGIYWCLRKGDTPHPNVEVLASRLGSNFQYLEIDGFDELFVDLNKSLAGVQRFAPQDEKLTQKQFDDLPATTATWVDIDADLALSTLRKYCEKLGRGAIDASQLKPLMRELGLLINHDGNEALSNACVLLFGKDVGRFFPQNVIAATVNHKNRKVFSGNLIEQYKSVIEWMSEEKINPTIKVKGRQLHETRLAYPERGLVELLVNMIVHRDFSIPKPSQVNVAPNAFVSFSNPGGPLPKAKLKLQMNADGRFNPVPQFSDLRNPALCDVFFGMNAMERAGTGLTDTFELAGEHGGTALFAYPPGEDRFVAELHRLEASAGSDDVARDNRALGTYTLNFLAFGATPKTLTHISVKATSFTELGRSASLSEAGTVIFERRTGDLWCFLPVAVANLIFEKVAKGPAKAIPLETVESDPVLSKKFSWLVRWHFENYLKTFENAGLVIEIDKKGHAARRAYFTAFRGNNRTHTYSTPKRANVRRDVVKRRGEGQKTWFECEGFGYEVVRQAGIWGIRIKPFYMFAKSDGKTPLPGYMRTSRATRRIKFDRNANVDSDLVFWARFLSQGSQTINIGGPKVDDLLLEGSFVSFDVQEGGLINGDTTQNRYSA